MYIDIHCHLDDERLSDTKSVVDEFKSRGVTRAIFASCSDKSGTYGKEIAEKFDEIYFTAGFHPDEIERFNEENFEKVKNLLKHPKCVGVGEIGLDYHYEPYDKELQQKVFIEQLKLANELDLPVEVHSRDATKDTFDILKANPLKRGGVMHCFSGSVEMAREFIKLGFYISFAGVVTFKNGHRAKEVAKDIPLNRILTETDCPYLAPEPVRGTLNSPKNIPFITKYIAELKGLTVEETASAVMENAKRLFYKLK